MKILLRLRSRQQHGAGATDRRAVPRNLGKPCPVVPRWPPANDGAPRPATVATTTATAIRRSRRGRDRVRRYRVVVVVIGRILRKRIPRDRREYVLALFSSGLEALSIFFFFENFLGAPSTKLLF